MWLIKFAFVYLTIRGLQRFCGRGSWFSIKADYALAALIRSHELGI